MKRFLKILGGCLFGALALFGMTAFITGDRTNYIIGTVFIIVGGGLCWLCLRRSPGEKIKQTPEQAEQLRRQRKADEEAWRAHVQEDIRQQQAAPPPEPPRQTAPPPPPPVYESRRAQQRRVAEERKQQAAQDGVACCPRCGSTSLSINKKGFGGGKATAGMLTFGLGGAVAGTYGMNRMKITCLNCGYKYKPGKRTRV